MSRSSSSQASSVTNNNINNVLDGGAIKSSFDFASGIADEAFDSVDNAVSLTKGVTLGAIDANSDVARAALNTNENVIEEAFDKYESLSSEAFEANNSVVNKALDSFQTQNNRSLDALAGLQGTQATNNFKLLEGIQKTIRNDNSGGATEVLENQKYLYFAMAALLIVFLILINQKVK
ncbi:hypothetical protein OPW13_12480 [Vibrio europaeus]|uniref:Uncharacterized protein n=1 Tax=Vibrio europaeus TaxID=300876 RepID=A0A178JB33_9VIBR|nr:hypothetical protein [Vibrio europaeus]MDC5704674.1 hypothetical protein [Vibrio europaeus]MDC5711588.1 hypothetical protein [Vibrio europaeus]MDC5713503.1 hypothetical protein [Vibrio europaeus]MDC5843402.1 hypothetical protein [Vibrio europaeus]MDC5860035.1 hypothetical protein [Vibrio europaeus]